MTGKNAEKPFIVFFRHFNGHIFFNSGIHFYWCFLKKCMLLLFSIGSIQIISCFDMLQKYFLVEKNLISIDIKRIRWDNFEEIRSLKQWFYFKLIWICCVTWAIFRSTEIFADGIEMLENYFCTKIDTSSKFNFAELLIIY